MKKLKITLILFISLFVFANEVSAQIKIYQKYRRRQHREMGYPDGRASAGAYKRGGGGASYKWGVGMEPVAMQSLDPLDASFNLGANVYGVYNVASKFALELGATYYFPQENTIFSIPSPFDMKMTNTPKLISIDLNTKFTFINENGSDFHIDAVLGGCYMIASRDFKVSNSGTDTTFSRSSNLIYINGGLCTNLKIGPGFLRLSTIVGLPVYNSAPIDTDFSTLLTGTPSSSSGSGATIIPVLPAYGTTIFYKIGLGYRLMF